MDNPVVAICRSVGDAAQRCDMMVDNTILALLLATLLFFITGFAATVYLVVLCWKLRNHLMNFHVDLCRDLSRGSCPNLRAWRWVFREEDEEDPKLFILKTAIRRWTLFQLSMFGAFVVATIMIAVIGMTTHKL